MHHALSSRYTLWFQSNCPSYRYCLHQFINFHNTNLGGDNAARGSVLGVLLGASLGIERFPRRWIDGLVDPPPDFL